MKARVTGELDERQQVTVNLQTTQEWIQIRTVILEVLASYPALRPEIGRRFVVLGSAKS